MRNSIGSENGLPKNMIPTGSLAGTGPIRRVPPGAAASRFPVGIRRKQIRMLLDECPIAIERKILVDATLKKRSPRSRVDDRGSQPTQVIDAALDDIDGLGVGRGEEFLVHVLANDADPDSVERPLVGEASIGLRRQPADAESGQLIPWIVAGDRFKH